MQNKIIFRRDITFRLLGDNKLTPRPDGRWELLVDDMCITKFNMFVYLKINGSDFFVNFTDIDVIEYLQGLDKE